MTRRCESCGAELFEGQQFCRVCGAAVVARDEATTQLLSDGSTQPQAPEASGTSPVWGAGTEPVGSRQSPAYQQPTAYQPPLQSFQQTSPLSPARPPRKGGRGLWFFALIVVFLLGAGVAGIGAFVWWKAQHQQIIVVKKGDPNGMGRPADIPRPPIPPDLGEQIQRAVTAATGVAAQPLDESGASVSADETVLTKTYQLDDEGSFSVRLVNGNVTITGADGDAAEVKIVKHGGSAQERAAARLLLAQTEGSLSFISAGAPSGVEVSYEVKVPRGLNWLEINTEKGDIKVSGFDGTVVTNVKQGNTEFRDVTGTVKSNVMKGETRVVYEKAEREGSQEFSVIKGDIEATLAEGTDAEIRAETVAGEIDADSDFGLSVEKRPVGRSLSGKLGDGGQTLRFKVTSGDIKLKK